MWNVGLHHLLEVDELLEEHRVLLADRTGEKMRMRADQNPFDMDNQTFIGLYRLTPDSVTNIVEELRPDLERQRSNGLTVEHQVLTALRFYAKGCHQDAVGEHWDLGLSQPSVSRSIKSVTEALNRRLMHQHVRFPMTPEERFAAKVKFMNARQPFPCTIGAIDCTYVNMIAPHNHEEAYVNHHGNHALNIQAICDPDLKILNVNARYPGARNDYFIWKNSSVHHALERSYGRGERNTLLIGDDGYFIEPWLMTPLKNEAAGTARFRYNEALCKARCVIERLFGVLKAEFRCISSANTLLYAPEIVGKIFNACALLHNIRIDDQVQHIGVNEADIQAEAQAQAQARGELHERGDDGAPLTQRAIGQRIQARLIAQHFT